MGIKVQLFYGKDCGSREGCQIKFDPNAQTHKFNPNHKYYLVDGTVSIQYEGEDAQEISSPYDTTWTNYVDSWNYAKNVHLRVSNSTVFAAISATQGNNENYIATNSSVITLNNSSLSVSMNSNSSILILGPDYSVDGVPQLNNKVRVINATSPKQINVATQQRCSIIYVEPL